MCFTKDHLGFSLKFLSTCLNHSLNFLLQWLQKNEDFTKLAKFFLSNFWSSFKSVYCKKAHLKHFLFEGLDDTRPTNRRLVAELRTPSAVQHCERSRTHSSRVQASSRTLHVESVLAKPIRLIQTNFEKHFALIFINFKTSQSKLIRYFHIRQNIDQLLSTVTVIMEPKHALHFKGVSNFDF